MEISVDDDVKKLIMSEGRDYRICTSCTHKVNPDILFQTPKVNKSCIIVTNFKNFGRNCNTHIG